MNDTIYDYDKQIQSDSLEIAKMQKELMAIKASRAKQREEKLMLQNKLRDYTENA